MQKRYWIPLVVVGVLALAGFIQYQRTHNTEVAAIDTSVKPAPAVDVIDIPGAELAGEIVEGLKSTFESIRARMTRTDERLDALDERVTKIEQQPLPQLKLNMQGLSTEIKQKLQDQVPMTVVPRTPAAPPKPTSSIIAPFTAARATGAVVHDVCESRALPPSYTERDAQLEYGMSRSQVLERKLAECDSPAGPQVVEDDQQPYRVAGPVVASAQVRINVGERRQHHGGRRASCIKRGPGFKFVDEDGGRCEKTVVLEGGFPKYDRPNVDCVPGTRYPDKIVPLPNGGVRRLHQSCHSMKEMRARQQGQ